MTPTKQYFINPCLNSRWVYVKNGIPVTYKITAIWGMGSAENYRPVSYDMKPATGGDTVKVSASDLHQWIRTNRITWSSN